MRQSNQRIAEFQQPGFLKESLRQSLYLLRKSLDRYEYLRELKAPGILLVAEKGLIRRQLLFLYSLREKLATSYRITTSA
jgi:hypothetical protein